MKWCRRTVASAFVLGILALGCGKEFDPQVVRVANLGLEMSLPEGWRTEQSDPRLFYEAGKADDNFGMIEDDELAGKSLESYVDEMLAGAFDAAVVSKGAATVGGHPAVEAVTEGRYRTIEITVARDDRAIRIWFRTLPRDFPEQEEAFRQALRSIRFD